MTIAWRSRSRRCAAALTLLIVPCVVRAQEEPYFRALAIPAPTLGTCKSQSAADSAGARRIQLVMRSRVPGYTRDITLMVDKTGRVRVYSELGGAPMKLGKSDADNILAGFDSAGRVRGRWSHVTVTVPDSILKRHDIETVRTIRDHMVTHTDSRALTSTEQRQVQAMAAWLRRRCSVA
jgi:hypothetical protein